MSCGSGLFSRRFARSGKFNAVIAADFSESMLGQARTYFEADNTIDPRYHLTEIDEQQLSRPHCCMTALQEMSRVSLLTMPQLGDRGARQAATDTDRSMQEIHSAESRCWQITVSNVLYCWHACWSSHPLLAQSHCSSLLPHITPDMVYHLSSPQTVQKRVSGIFLLMTAELCCRL